MLKNISKLLLIIGTINLSASQSYAREFAALGYQELFNKSDLVVIATPTTKTTDTKEKTFLPNIFQQDKNGKSHELEVTGVETTFSAVTVFKGNNAIKQFKLHHYRETENPEVETDGPGLVFFDLSDNNKHSYLLFLIREKDGRYAPTGGQTDPDFKSVTPIIFEDSKI